MAGPALRTAAACLGPQRRLIRLHIRFAHAPEVSESRPGAWATPLAHAYVARQEQANVAPPAATLSRTHLDRMHDFPAPQACIWAKCGSEGCQKPAFGPNASSLPHSGRMRATALHSVRMQALRACTRGKCKPWHHTRSECRLASQRDGPGHAPIVSPAKREAGGRPLALERPAARPGLAWVFALAIPRGARRARPSPSPRVSRVPRRHAIPRGARHAGPSRPQSPAPLAYASVARHTRSA